MLHLSEEEIILILHLKRQEAAIKLNCNIHMIPTYRKKYNVIAKKGRPKTLILLNKECECGKLYTTERIEQLYCSPNCYHLYGKHIMTSEGRINVSIKAKQRWTNPTENMLQGIEKRKLSIEELKDYKRYRNRLKILTEKTYIEYIDIINPYGHIRGVAGIENAYHLDHIMPARFGFENNIPVEFLAEKENLQMLPWRDNIVKGKKYGD